MQISCERCGTTYALDEKLIPAGGAPVQCTRCGHIFTALPPGAAAAPKSEPVNKTQIFGGASGGTPPPTSPPAPQSQSQSPRAATQMFGASTAAAAASVPNVSPAQAPTTGASRPKVPAPGAQIQGPAVSPGGGSRSTQMFGAATAAPPSAPSPAAGPDRPSTQMFGGSAAAQVPGLTPAKGKSGPEPTQMFGASPPAPASVPAPETREPTQMFGGAQVRGPAPGGDRSSTQMFGASPLQDTQPGGVQIRGPLPGADRSSTQMFGAPVPQIPQITQVPTAGAAPPMFGNAQVRGPAPGASTQMFGVQAAQPAPLPAASGPLPMFSAPQVAPAPAPGVAPPKRTQQMFGAVGPDQVSQPPPPLASTQMFGAPGALGDGARSRSGPTAAAPEAAADSVPSTDRPATPIHGGALPKIAAMTPAPLPEEGFADTIIRDRSRIPDTASTAPTQMFGAPDEKDLERIWKERRSRGSRFTQPDTTEPNVPLYRMERTTDPDNPEAPPIGGEPPTMGSSPTPIDTPFNRAPTPPETPVAARLELPPEAPELIPEPRTEESGAGEAAALRRRLQRRTLVAAGAVGVVLLVIIGVIAGRALANRRKAAPPELIARREEVHLLLRRDDGASRERAVAALDGMVSSYPEFTLAQADLVVALALQLDDARIQVRRLTAEADDLNRKVARLNEEKIPSDWQNRVNAMTERLGEIQKATNPLMEQVGGVDARLNDRVRALQAVQATAPEDQVAVMRAQAVYFGVKGSDQAIVLAERYKNLGGAEGWGAVAVAELALNARVTPDAIAGARAAMDELSTKDSTFLRSYVLSARLAMAQKHADSAISGLEAVLALNPSHEVARQLLDWARSGQP